MIRGITNVIASEVFTFNQQFRFLREQDLGVDITKTLILRAPANVDSSYLRNLNGFKNTLIGLSLAKNIASSSEIPGNTIGWTGSVKSKEDETGFNFTITPDRPVI